MFTELSGMPMLGPALQVTSVPHTAYTFELIQHIDSCALPHAMAGFVPGKIGRMRDETIEVQRISANVCR